MRLSADGRGSPSPLDRFRIAARHSDLARLQAYRVGQALKKQFPNAEIEYAFRASLGDLNQSDPLWKMPEKGVFTEDFLNDLISGTADLVVHSWKDLPTEVRRQTSIVATLPRADSRDLLLFRRDRLLKLAQARGAESTSIRILTSSPRRTYNLEGFLKEHLPFAVSTVQFEAVRGNIPTRLGKLLSQDADGLIVAKAALDRLLEAPEPEFQEVQMVIRNVLRQTRFIVLPLSVNPTAAAQGALAIEIANHRQDLKEALQSIHCQETELCVQKERAILASYGGGCHQKIGISRLKRAYGEVTFLKGLTVSGEVLDYAGIDQNVSPEPQRALSGEACFPREGEEFSFFDRSELPREAWASIEEAQYLWVARETAWPKQFQSPPIAAIEATSEKIVWTAGVKTWRKLAERGVWVSGTADGLGEDEEPHLTTLLEGAGFLGAALPVVPWVKLTHSLSNQMSVMPAVATYELKAKQEAPDLRGRTHFFWMSGSSFDRALELYPEIQSMHHACGPGLSHRHICERLGQKVQVGTYLDLESWRRAVLPIDVKTNAIDVLGRGKKTP